MSKAIDNFHLLSSKQRKFILNNDEVLSDLVKSNMSERRYNHSLGVGKMAVYLASYHHVDINKAYKAGILHDIAKELSDEEIDLYLKYYDKDKLDMPIKVKHSYVGKYYLKEKLHIHDSEILNAIYNHTILESNDKLSMIIYIADKREDGRGIHDQSIEIAKKDLKKAVEYIKEEYRKNKEKYD